MGVRWAIRRTKEMEYGGFVDIMVLGDCGVWTVESFRSQP